jgi:hypothetical protein
MREWLVNDELERTLKEVVQSASCEVALGEIIAGLLTSAHFFHSCNDMSYAEVQVTGKKHNLWSSCMTAGALEYPVTSCQCL